MPEKGKFPRRIEVGLCPDLEEALCSVADELARLAESVRALAADGLIGSEGVAEQAKRIEGIARTALIDGDELPDEVIVALEVLPERGEHSDGCPTEEA